MMNSEFNDYLKYGHKSSKLDSFDGGYLVPPTIQAEKSGVVSYLYRFFGRFAKNKSVYAKGLYTMNIHEEMQERVKFLRIDK